MKHMKRAIIFVTAILTTLKVLALQPGEPVQPTWTGYQKPLGEAGKNTGEELTVVLGNDLIRFVGNDSIVIVKMGNRILNLKGAGDGLTSEYDFNEPAEKDSFSFQGNYDDYGRSDHKRRFRGHWAGFEVGFNNYRYFNSSALPPEIEYMSLDAGNSNCFNLNFSQTNIGFGRHSGIVTGLGLNWNTYRFKGSSSIAVTGDGTIGEVLPDVADIIKKSKFSVLYLNVPLLLEVQLPAGYSSRLSLSGGLIGGMKLLARTKIVYEDGEKIHTKGDYNLNLLRAGATVRLGFENLNLFGTWYFTPWFQERKGPEGFNLEPFEIGLAFTFND